MTASGPFHFSPRANRAADIPWQEWSDEVFERARRDDLPVLLSISGTWCHWCHVMDETTYSDERVIDLVARRFVAVRVDTDERPDVNARYNAGGWPTTAFLTSDGDVIAKTTYLDPDQMLDALTGVQEQWLVNRDGIAGAIETARATRAAERAAEAGRRTSGSLTPSILDVALDIVEAAYDAEHGGFREPERAAEDAEAAPDETRAALRFPHADALRLWRYAHHRRGTPDVLDRAVFVLDRMVDGGLYDAVDGGFYRYATQPDWSAPHVEKLAADQGAILLAIAEVAISDEDAADRWREPVERTVAYINATLGNYLGGIASAQDADQDYAALPDRLARSMVPAPAVDARVFAASCAIAARGLMACGVAFNRRDWTERGLRAVDFLAARMRGGEAGMYHAWDDGPQFLGLLADQAHAMLAFLHAYEVTGIDTHLDAARALARTLQRGWREPGRGFWDTADGHEDTALLAEPLMPLAENVAVAEAFLWLGRLTHDERHLQVALETLSAFASGLEARGLAIADFARVVDRLLTAEPEFKVVSEWPAGEPDRVADPLFLEALRLPLAARTVQRLSLPQDDLLMRQLGLPLDRTRVAYVCVGSVCSAPVTQPDGLPGAIEQATAAPTW
ncbi:MAG: thioredoxin domain-containing protein [Dehalococcoidia bacterium]